MCQLNMPLSLIIINVSINPTFELDYYKPDASRIISILREWELWTEWVVYVQAEWQWTLSIDFLFMSGWLHNGYK